MKLPNIPAIDVKSRQDLVTYGLVQGVVLVITVGVTLATTIIPFGWARLGITLVGFALVACSAIIRRGRLEAERMLRLSQEIAEANLQRSILNTTN